jgi:hypothetical protein
MRRRTIGLQLSCLAILLICHQATARADLTPIQTQSTGGLVATNWTSGITAGTTTPTFHQFDSSLGALLEVKLTFSANIVSDYELSFTSQSTNTVTQSLPSNPADGVILNLTGPVAGPALLSVAQAASSVSLTESSGTFSSFLPSNDPNYITPTDTSPTGSLSLTSGALFSDFVGTGNILLPVNAEAYSSFLSSNGQGGGGVFTSADAVVTVQYMYAAVPEPSSSVLLSLGIGLSLLCVRRLRDRANELPPTSAHFS